MAMEKSVRFVKKIENNYLKDKNIRKLEIIVIIHGEYRRTAHSICNLKYSASKKFPVTFHNGCNSDYHHFIIKVLAAKLKKRFTCLGENSGKNLTFRVPIEKRSYKI